ncbi:type I 3-dehydroquinate dehydratase [Eubacterium xylanophilum]|uniref:type I 3-dehydroquinate dehydratase n=1 Tax=Eubacterium xylanophilum TaxID=39497 RepID=UPI0004ADF69A|nr:type I 3-dehydroquinate dehydratase [Eubacterium xylanophilum]
MNRTKICIPIVEKTKESIIDKAEEYAELRAELVEWRVDFFEGEESEILEIVRAVKKAIKDKDLIVTIRTIQEGGEENGARFDYKGVLEEILKDGYADFIDVEVAYKDVVTTLVEQRDKLTVGGNYSKLIGSYHNFSETPSEEFIFNKLDECRKHGLDVGKVACMPKSAEDVDVLLDSTEKYKKDHKEYPIITMSMGEYGKRTRLYGGLYGSEVTFACVGKASAPGQVELDEVNKLFDGIFSGNRHISLIGFMGVGKSTISAELAKITGRPEVDADVYIEKREGMKISDIFASQGEEYFRDIETEILDELAGMEPMILSCGGGMAIRKINVKKLQNMGDVVLLTAEPETIYERVKDSNTRPLLNGNMNVEYIAELMAKREPFYEEAATIEVKTDGRGAEEIAREIVRLTDNVIC